MAQSPTLLFCVGATKAGTSWLYSYFSGHPAFYLRSVKELHYFYAHETEASWPLTWLKNHIAEFREDIPGTSAERAAYRTVRLRDCRELAKLLRNPLDEEAYVAYLTRWRANQAVVGDFSPSYGLLSTERLRAMARILPDVRFLFVMRDPVARLWSNVRMIAQRRDPKGGFEAQSAADILDQVLTGGEIEMAQRSDYRGIIERLQAAVVPSQLKISVYEELLSGPGLRDVCGFLDIEPHDADLSKRVHEGVALEMTPKQRAAAYTWLLPQYKFVEQMMGQLPPSWQRTPAEA